MHKGQVLLMYFELLENTHHTDGRCGKVLPKLFRNRVWNIQLQTESAGQTPAITTSAAATCSVSPCPSHSAPMPAYPLLAEDHLNRSDAGLNVSYHCCQGSARHSRCPSKPIFGHLHTPPAAEPLTGAVQWERGRTNALPGCALGCTSLSCLGQQVGWCQPSCKQLCLMEPFSNYLHQGPRFGGHNGLSCSACPVALQP